MNRSTLPILSVPTMSESGIIVTASFVNIGVGEITRCGFMVHDSPEIYKIGSFESGTLDGLIPTSTNSSMQTNQIAVIDTITTSGSASKYAVKLCSSGRSQTSKLSANVKGPVNFSFSWKVSSDRNYDKLNWYLNGALQMYITGEVGWKKETKTLLSGNHKVEFTYSKDNSYDGGADCGWLDDVTLGEKEPTIYESIIIPTEIGRPFAVLLAGLPNKPLYIASFAENAAGRAMSQFIPYEKPSIWASGNIHETEARLVECLIIGDAQILRSKIDCIYIGSRAF